jgi:hypothetical protein
MVGGGAAAKQEYERQLEMKNQKFRELEEERTVSKSLIADLMLNVKSVKQQVRKYAEEPVIFWSDDCEWKQQVSAVAYLLKKIVITERDAKNWKPEATTGRNSKLTVKSKQKQTAGRGIVPTLMSRKL